MVLCQLTQLGAGAKEMSPVSTGAFALLEEGVQGSRQGERVMLQGQVLPSVCGMELWGLVAPLPIKQHLVQFPENSSSSLNFRSCPTDKIQGTF